MTYKYILTLSGTNKPGRLKSNWDASTAPSAGDDEDSGYGAGSLWLDQAAHRAYICEDPASGAATWLELTDSGPDLTGIDFLVGTATGLLSGEIPAGTSPGGELGGTWASPTVDATHSGSSHAATQAAAEATAAAALSAHLNDATDAHDASAISVLDTGGNFAATDVEGALAELAATPPGDPGSDTHVWMPLTTVVGGEPFLVWDEPGLTLIPDLVPLETP